MQMRSFFLAGTAFVLAQLPALAGAQTKLPASEGAGDAIDGNEIIVQARKRNERLSDIPETISAISAETIQRAGISSLNDVGRQTPNIVLNRRQDNEPNVVIRGVGAFGNTQGVGFYIDDVQNFTDQSAALEDVERIEILKGPQGTLYGGSNIGGAIKYVLKKPGPNLGAEGKVEAGSFETVNVSSAINAPLTSILSARISTYYNKFGGYVRNTLLGGHPDASREWGARLALGWQPVDGVDVQFSYRHNDISNGGNVYVASGETASGGTIYARTVDYNVDVANKRRVDGAILDVSYDMGPAELTSVTSYTKRNAKFRWDLDYSAADAVTALNGKRHEAEIFTQELRLASSDNGPFDWLVGAYYASIDNRGITNNADLIFGPNAGGPTFVENYNNGDTIEKQYALFGTANYSFGDFHIGAGMRVARSAFTGRDENVPLSVDVNKTTVLPKITLSYKIAPDTMLYANYAIGSEPGRVNVTTGTGGAYKDERAASYEAGIKGSLFNHSLTYELAGFYIDYKRRQFESQFVNSDGAVAEEVTNIGKSVSYGVEGGFTYTPVRGLNLAGSAGYLHSRWDDKAAMFNFAPIDGLTVPNSPSFTANASIDYSIPLSNSLELGMRADFNHMGQFYWNIPNTSFEPSYNIVNLRASVGDPNGSWEFAVRGENVFNTKYFTEFNPDIFSPGIGFGAPSMPARVIASISFKF